ncbi:hypothetical protein AB0M87_16670 [Streptomyces sp. NPDC051320]|uniref:hypothetical protein n=1 Tax=Streptomyces sp. NPDC051320 TaxID=3154644 RepID=UPI00343494FF
MWRPHDRFAIVVVEPFGALGTSLLVQAATAQHFDAVPTRREGLRIYPEIYAIHVGGCFGDLGAFDFWPARKEVFVENGPLAGLAALNDRAITCLAVPDVTETAVDFPRLTSAGWSERNSVLERLTSACAYSAGGRVANPDSTITGLDPATEMNASFTLDPQSGLDAYGAMTAEDFAGRWDGAEFETGCGCESSLHEQPAHVHERAVESRRTLVDGGPVTESYRRIGTDQALGMLVR